jgi:hypothetical protein
MSLISPKRQSRPPLQALSWILLATSSGNGNHMILLTILYSARTLHRGSIWNRFYLEFKMKFFKSALIALGSLAAISSAKAVVVNGLDIGSGTNFQVASVYENPVFTVGNILRGYGEVTQINGVSISLLCAGCELTYRFDNYAVTSITGTTVAFSGGVVNFYIGYGADNDFNPFASSSSAADVAAATNGTLFLSLQGHAVDALGNTLLGGGVNIGTPSATGNGSGLLDVIGGSAAAFFNTNSIGATFGGPADFLLTSSFNSTTAPHPAECAQQIFTSCLAGSADLRGAVQVPAPAIPALLGLGLLGFGMLRRRG